MGLATTGHKNVIGRVVALLVTTLNERMILHPLEITPPALIPIKYYPAGIVEV